MSIREKLVNSSLEKLASFEGRLSGIFRPIAPRREFVSGLRHKIEITRPTMVGKISNLESLLLLILGVLVGVILVAMAIRALLSFLGIRGFSRSDVRKKVTLVIPSQISNAPDLIK